MLADETRDKHLKKVTKMGQYPYV